jgi:hypothetical protein
MTNAILEGNAGLIKKLAATPYIDVNENVGT